MDLLRSLPIGIYVEKPVSWLHRLDPRVKLGWLMSLILSPLLANPPWRIFLVLFLVLVTLWAGIPWRLQKTQISWLVFFLSIVFLVTVFAGDGFNLSYQPRLPDSFLSPPTASNYKYVLYQLGQFTITRRSLDLAIRITTLIFTLLYSSNLYLLTTAPEKIAAGIEDLLSPLNRFKLPINEIILTLILALRFIPLVLEEVQNLVRSVRTRAINWQKLGFRRGLQVWLIVAERLVQNILLRAEQIAIAMEVRGFTNPGEHRVKWHELKLKTNDLIALFLLGAFWLVRGIAGG
ncbi:MAG: CbiQ family ECF transporter T component [Geminocystis sp.]|nr:CbiQ family ECF transporter T component [Geminocystis sp.]HIK37382.1 energy-coupling factor transporter transmembrane protein EcfT [Geminocystis sp. M7585_C2015_104]MCS7148499.1 CbiQ family ECF transporter T component [Geminocystis sp.]MCX8079455.1 CbiQ family ECF transporter T component [Geminocystis sp.]MDW8114927.1 CbiQ family ECF transporter T component [Geminocystis sp.]